MNKQKYEIRYAGSTFGGENPIKSEVNTIDKIFNLASNKNKSGGFTESTSISKSGNEWVFSGNYKNYSSVFWVDVYDEKLASTIRNKLRNKKRYF